MGFKLWYLCMYVYVCFVLCLRRDWFCWLTCEGVNIWEEFWNVNLLMVGFECCEVTLCGWQDVTVQLLTTGWPPPPPPNATQKNANNVYMSSANSYFVHVNFSLCIIIPQSFQFVGQVVWLLCSLQNVFQMTPLALQAHLQAMCKIVGWPWSWL